MIGKLTGRVDDKGSDHVLIDVHGVGYLVACATTTLERLAQDAVATLLIETQVREDAIRLFGFASAEERDWFRLLQNVQGVGAKVALNVLSVCPPAALQRAIVMQDKASVGRAPGVGPKLAQRIVAELKDKVPALSQPLPVAAVAGAKAAATRPSLSAAGEAVSALINLGYAQSEAAEAVSAALAAAGDGAGVEALIRSGLKELSR
ncbi:MAG: Holliday junction branch migration protein RuvA [Alphaproteobacteria bacterium]|nr:Holliday junction branch migration protein RuvA [Alphaproteobacteria bacterium]